MRLFINDKEFEVKDFNPKDILIFDILKDGKQYGRLEANSIESAWYIFRGFCIEKDLKPEEYSLEEVKGGEA